MSKNLSYTIELKPIEDGGFVVTVPALPGCITQGNSYDHALEMAREAIEGYIAVLVEDGDPIPEESQDQKIRIADVEVTVPAAQ